MKQWLETREVLDFLTAAGTAGKRAALATVVRVRGSAYRHEGAKLVVAEGGSTAGNVSGGGLGQDGREGGRPGVRPGGPEPPHHLSRGRGDAGGGLGGRGGGGGRWGRGVRGAGAAG